MSWRRPHAIAEQARHARGLLGRLIAFIMARETWGANRRAIAALEIRPGDRVLDVGCGHGRGLGALAALASEGQVTGIDPSALMVEIAARRLRKAGVSGRTRVLQAEADRLPFADASFDAALCVHVVYFWPDLAGPLGEIARVLRPGGRLALLFRTSADAASASAFPADVYRFRSRANLTAALAAAGFRIAGGDTPGEPALVLAVRQP